MPAKGISLHIGLNFVNPEHYDGWDGELTACEFDAKDMQALAKKKGFEPYLMLTKAATADAVVKAITAAAGRLGSGDIFLISYSGHGGQVPDTNSDEKDPERQDETWVLWDRQLVDDELWNLWSKFKAGVRIFVLSDSCHSGTVTRLALIPPEAGSGRPKLLPPRKAAKVYQRNAELYDAIQKSVPSVEKASLRSTVILISGCMDNQLSMDGNRNGLFTETLKKVWRNGLFVGGHRKFRDRIVQRMPPDQTPNYYVVGKSNRAFESQKPFTI